MGRVTATKTQKQQLRRWHSSQRPAPTLRGVIAWYNTRFTTPRWPRHYRPGTVVCDLQEVGQILDAMSLSQFILSAAENNDLREEEDLLTTMLAYH